MVKTSSCEQSSTTFLFKFHNISNFLNSVAMVVYYGKCPN